MTTLNIEELSERKIDNDVEQKQPEVNEMDEQTKISSINIDKATDEIIENKIFSRMNPPRTPESDGEDIKEKFEDIYIVESSKDQYPEFNTILNNIQDTPPMFGDHNKNCAELTEKLINNVEIGYDEIIKHVTERKDVLLKEIDFIQKQNEEETEEIKNSFEKVQNKMKSFQTEIDKLNKLETITERDNEIKKIIFEAMRYHQHNKHNLDTYNISNLLNKSKLLTLSLFFDENNLKNTIFQNFKLLSNAKLKEKQEKAGNREYNNCYEQKDERGIQQIKEQFPRYVENYYENYENRNNSWNSWRSNYQNNNNNNNRSRRERGRRQRGRGRGRESGRGQRRDRNRAHGRGRRRRRDTGRYNNTVNSDRRERERGYVFNDYIPTAPAPAPTPAPVAAAAQPAQNSNWRGVENNNGSIDEKDMIQPTSISTSPRKRKKWTVKQLQTTDIDENKNGDVEENDGFLSNTHHIFVRDTEDLDLIPSIQKYRDIVLICQFSEQYHSKNGLKLSKNRTLLQRMENQKHGYAVLDCKPVSQGQHCWRIKCKNFSPWIFIGVCRPYIQYTDTSWNNKYIWGISTCSQSNRNGHWALDYSVKSPHWKNKTILEIDMLLDCNDGILKYKHIPVRDNNEDKDTNIIVLDGLDRNNKDHTQKDEVSWVPHFNLHTPGSAVSVKKIPHSRFGQLW